MDYFSYKERLSRLPIDIQRIFDPFYAGPVEEKIQVLQKIPDTIGPLTKNAALRLALWAVDSLGGLGYSLNGYEHSIKQAVEYLRRVLNSDAPSRDAIENLKNTLERAGECSRDGSNVMWAAWSAIYLCECSLYIMDKGMRDHDMSLAMDAIWAVCMTMLSSQSCECAESNGALKNWSKWAEGYLQKRAEYNV